MRLRRHIYPVAVAVTAVIAATSCAGRTAGNMVPSGDTVEVNIDSTEIIVSETPDSVAVDSTAEAGKTAE